MKCHKIVCNTCHIRAEAVGKLSSAGVWKGAGKGWMRKDYLGSIFQTQLPVLCPRLTEKHWSREKHIKIFFCLSANQISPFELCFITAPSLSRASSWLLGLSQLSKTQRAQVSKPLLLTFSSRISIFLFYSNGIFFFMIIFKLAIHA